MSLIAGNLGVVQKLFDSNHLRWAVCAGAAAHLYGTRRPIQDIDILIERGTIRDVVNLFQQQQKAVQYDGRRVLWRGIKVFDDLTIIRSGNVQHTYLLDDGMLERMQRRPLLGTLVNVLCPEDVLAHKVVTARGVEEGKHDLTDAKGIVQRQTVEGSYLLHRLTTMNALHVARSHLLNLGLEPDTWQSASPSVQ